MLNRESRSGGQVLVDQLLIQGTQHVFCVPGESYLAALNALYNSPIEVTVCRQEGGAAMMAEAHGKITGRPGICFVTRGPGATNASPGIHVAAQDSTPMILFVGQVELGMRWREAFQEIDYRATFGSVAKWVVEIDDAARIPEQVSRAFQVATNGRPGPVVVVLPEDMLTQMVVCQDGRRVTVALTAPVEKDLVQFDALLSAASKPMVVVGGGNWTQSDITLLKQFVEARGLPVAVSFRRQSSFPASHPNFIGELGVASNPAVVEAARSSDFLLLLGTRLSEISSQAYTLLSIPVPTNTVVHVHPGQDELGSVYQAKLSFNMSMSSFLQAIHKRSCGPKAPDRTARLELLRAAYTKWATPAMEAPGRLNLGLIVRDLVSDRKGPVTLTTGAGNYAIWVNRFFKFRDGDQLLAPTSGSMGYGIPAAVAASRVRPGHQVIAFAGDGCFLMNGQEFATAVQYSLPIIVILVDNGMYGTIRMHQENHFPGRVIATDLKNPDFAAYAIAFGGHGERVVTTQDFSAAYQRAVKSGLPSIIHCLVDPEALTPNRSLSEIRTTALTRLENAETDQ